jgi:hypothetical protein
MGGREPDVKTETETKMGRCPTHGTVEGRREIPRVAFPFVLFAVMRAMARRKPFFCPTCDKPIN